MVKEFDIGQYQEKVLTDIKQEVMNSDVARQRCRIISFISRSAGRGRKRGRERYVELLVVDDNYAYCVLDNEVKPRKKRDHHVAIDVLANEVLSDLPENERTVDCLLQRVRKF